MNQRGKTILFLTALKREVPNPKAMLKSGLIELPFSEKIEEKSPDATLSSQGKLLFIHSSKISGFILSILLKNLLLSSILFRLLARSIIDFS